MRCASVPFICTVGHPLIWIGRSMRTWEWAFLISMVITAAPVARNRVVLLELEKGLLLLGFFVCDLTFDGFLCYLQRLHGSCRQPLSKRVRGPSISHVADFKKKTENSNQTGKASESSCCLQCADSVCSSLPCKHAGKALSCTCRG